MLMDNLKIRTKLLFSFSVILILSVIIGIVSITSITRINNFLKLNTVANSVVEFANSAQAANLRFVYYRDKKYGEDARGEQQKILKILEESASAIKISKADSGNFSLISDNTKTLIDNTTALLSVFDEKQASISAIVKSAQKLYADTASLEKTGTSFLKNSERGGMVNKGGFERYADILDIKTRICAISLLFEQFQVSTSAEAKKDLEKQLRNELGIIEKNFTALHSQMTMAESRKLIDDSLLEITSYKKNYDLFIGFDSQYTQLVGALREGIIKTVDIAVQVKNGIDSSVKSTTEKSILFVIIFVLVIIVLSIFISLTITNSITVPLRRFIGIITDNLAKGDLSAEIQEKDLAAKDEIGDAARGIMVLLEKLREVITVMQNATAQVTTGSEQIAESSQQLSAGASEQAASMEEVSSSMEELVSNIEQNTDNASTADSIAKKLAKDAKEGESSVKNTVEAMREIAEKIVVIDEIARNTNMLALNAAIEAARAGDAGKGFAVVASEIRKLAENSQKAASDISVIAKTSVETAEKAGKIIGDIIPDIHKTADLMQEIANASAEQNNGAQQINTALMQLDSVTQSNASASEELASMSRELTAQSEEVKTSVDFFSLRHHEKSIASVQAKTEHAETEKIAQKKEQPKKIIPQQKKTEYKSSPAATSQPHKDSLNTVPAVPDKQKAENKAPAKRLPEDNISVDDGFREF